MARIISTILLALSLVSIASCQGSLLEMSQDLWSKLLAGGLTKVGKLDPLRVPIIKVDQSEGDTSYRMILKNVDIQGLNDSTLESIHIARGRLKSNLSELEAGYVSYSDLRDLDSIRYRFHTLLKEPKTQNESFEAIVAATNHENKFTVEPSPVYYRDPRLERIRQYDPFLLKIQGDEMKDIAKGKEESRENEQKTRTEESIYGSFVMDGARVHGKSDVQMIYAQRAMNTDANRRNHGREEGAVDCGNNCQARPGLYPGESHGTHRHTGRKGDVLDSERTGERFDDVEVSASENVETRLKTQSQRTRFASSSREQGREETERESRTRSSLEKRPGYIDIVYADEKNNGSFKRFGNVKLDPSHDATVYGLDDMMKDIRENRRFIIHNFTEGESLTKRNDAVRTAMEAKRLKDLIRYAKNYQEKEGYFEEGMQLIYHYGGMDSKNTQGSENNKSITRHKREHKEDNTEEDVMHLIMKIRVPLLRVKSEYQLMGKVGNELLRGNGNLNGNFTELIGDFTIELKKVNDDMMIVRAARSKLVAKDQKVSLQGMDEKGPVESILTHGLMAAEAVAAMLADDLATKALSEKTADAMIYRMYKNLPAN